MTDNIVERADLAVDAELQKLFPEWEWDQRQAIAAICARAAIAALREPSEAMIEAGDDCYSVARGTESWAIAGCKGSEQIWRAMLDASLSTEGKPYAG